MFVSVLISAVLFHLGCAQDARPIKVQNCLYNTSDFVRSGNSLRKKGDCQQGYSCVGNEIKPFPQPCSNGTYFSVHTGKCSLPNVYAYVFVSFNCSAEEDDPNLDFGKLEAKRKIVCEHLSMQSNTAEVTEWYVGDPDNCRNLFVCGLGAVWMYVCPWGYRFKEGEEVSCAKDLDECGLR